MITDTVIETKGFTISILSFSKKCLSVVLLTALASCTASITPNTGASPQPSPTASAAAVSANSGVAVFDATLTGNLNDYRGQNGKEVVIKTTGRADGNVWGDGVYTDDSDIGAAAVHAGLLKPGQEGIVRVVILPGQETYASATRNGVSSSDYGSWSGSFRFAQVNASAVTPIANTGVPMATDLIPANQAIYKNPGSVGSYRALVGQRVLFEVKATPSGTVWGNDVYTDDSDVGTAALHAGLLKANETGIVTVEMLPGQASYQASTRNGVTTFAYESWGGSFKFVGAARYVNNTGSLTIIANPTP